MLTLIPAFLRANFILLGVVITSSVELLTYMTVSTSGEAVFHWFSGLTTIAYLLTWTCICYSHTRLRRALGAAKIDICRSSVSIHVFFFLFKKRLMGKTRIF